MKKLTLFALSALFAGTFAVAADMGMKDEMKDANTSMHNGAKEVKAEMKHMKHETHGMKKDAVKKGSHAKKEMKKEMKKGM